MLLLPAVVKCGCSWTKISGASRAFLEDSCGIQHKQEQDAQTKLTRFVGRKVTGSRFTVISRRQWLSSDRPAAKTGFLDLELCVNPGLGSCIPTQDEVTYTAADQGLSKSVAYTM
jgi:hypothetical protein